MMQSSIKIHKNIFEHTNQTKTTKSHEKFKEIALKNIFYQFFDKIFTKNHKKLYF